VDDRERLAEPFEKNRAHLQAVAYRMLGSASEAEDAVQEAWLRLSRADTSAVENLKSWLTTVVARVCLDVLRARKAHPVEALDGDAPERAEPRVAGEAAIDPEREAELADSVGLALLVVLENLAPAERLAFVLHDLFDVPFEEIAAIVGRTPTATRQLASRARRRVQGAPLRDDIDVARQRRVVDAFLAALRSADFDGLIAVLDPEIVVHADGASSPDGRPRVIRGAVNWARGAIAFSKGVRGAAARSTFPALVDGSVALVFAPSGRLSRVLRTTIANDKIVAVEIIGDPARLAELEIAALAESSEQIP
jgi:RNA polymerase sigma-70 factor (ECF subfamily)